MSMPAQLLLPWGWYPVTSAPLNATWVCVVSVPQKLVKSDWHWAYEWEDVPNGETTEYRAHWASDLSGEDQPAFQGWFRESGTGHGFVEIPGRVVGWRPL